MEFEDVQPHQIAIGDKIGKKNPDRSPMRVDAIDAPQEYGVAGPIRRQWTFTELGEGRGGIVNSATYKEGEQVRRYRD